MNKGHVIVAAAVGALAGYVVAKKVVKTSHVAIATAGGAAVGYFLAGKL